jgi:hypothetical protein
MKSVKYLLILLGLALTVGCVRENTDDCYSIVTLRFSYTGDNGTEIFNEKIEKLDLYIFDESNRVVHERTLTPGELASRSAEVQLAPGQTYRAVCVGNAHGTSLLGLYEGTASETKMTHPVIHPDVETGDRRVDSYDHLYHGSQNLAVTRAGDESGTIQLASSHIDMVVEVAGYHPDASGRADGEQPLFIEHTNLPAWTDFDNQCPFDDNVSHFPAGIIRDGTYVFEYNVMRNLDETFILLHNAAGEVIYTLDVPAFLAEHPELDARLHEAVVPIRIEFKNLEVVVSIPEWAIEKTKPEF